MHPFDLHVLSTPPAFVLSQDQTLHRNLTGPIARLSLKIESRFNHHTWWGTNWHKENVTSLNKFVRSIQVLYYFYTIDVAFLGTSIARTLGFPLFRFQGAASARKNPARNKKVAAVRSQWSGASP